jgi:peptide chain release factor 1
MELKAGVGGAEAALFLSEMLRMYERLAASRGFEVSLLSKSDLDQGGMRDAVVEIKGDGAYDTLRAESGVHRVQRVPATETGGRTHTSTVAIVVCSIYLFLACPSLTSAGSSVNGGRRSVRSTG